MTPDIAADSRLNGHSAFETNVDQGDLISIRTACPYFNSSNFDNGWTKLEFCDRALRQH
jgi:hypothetical protein